MGGKNMAGIKSRTRTFGAKFQKDSNFFNFFFEIALNGYLDKFFTWISLHLPKEALNALRKTQFTIKTNLWNTLYFHQKWLHLLLFLFILFMTNTFPCLCASSSFAHLASVLRESLQLLFFLNVSMYQHFKQSGYPKLFKLTWISKLPWSCNLFSGRKSAGMGRFCSCQELVQSKNGLF